jgi:hypothetical protein
VLLTTYMAVHDMKHANSPVTYGSCYVSVNSVLVVTAVAFTATWSYLAFRTAPVHDRRYIDAVRTGGLILSTQVAVALLTWAAALWPLAYQTSTLSPPLGLAGLVAGVVFLLFMPLASLIRLLRTQQARMGGVALMTTILLIIPGLTLLAVYCHQMDGLDTYNTQYYGPMKILYERGVKIESHTVQAGRFQGGEYVMHFATPRVSWDCSQSVSFGSVSACEASVFDPECTVCEGGQFLEHQPGCSFRGTPDDARNCVADKYELTTTDAGYEDDTATLTGMETSNRNGQPPPVSSSSVDDDVGDNSIVPTTWNFFGDCATCQATEPEGLGRHVETLQQLREVAVLLLLCSICTYMLVAFLWSVAVHWDKNQNDESRRNNRISEQELVERSNILQARPSDSTGRSHTIIAEDDDTVSVARL